MPRSARLLVVVSPAFQNGGIGTQLVRSCADVARELGYQRIWLPVDATNVRARHVYRKCGFEYVSNRPSRELDMVLDVTRLAERADDGTDESESFSAPFPQLHFRGPLNSPMPISGP